MFRCVSQSNMCALEKTHARWVSCLICYKKWIGATFWYRTCAGSFPCSTSTWPTLLQRNRLSNCKLHKPYNNDAVHHVKHSVIANHFNVYHGCLNITMNKFYIDSIFFHLTCELSTNDVGYIDSYLYSFHEDSK